VGGGRGGVGGGGGGGGGGGVDSYNSKKRLRFFVTITCSCSWDTPFKILRDICIVFLKFNSR